MSDMKDFVIENGVLTKYVGPGGDVVIPDGVKEIGNNAFWFCEKMTDVTIPDSVTSIGVSAFGSCSSLMSVTILDSVTSIGDFAFRECRRLTSVTIPNRVTSIGAYAFSGCSGLTSVTIPDSVKNIGFGAFADCRGLTSITLPSSIARLKDSVFRGCTSLKRINAPGVTEFAHHCCDGCVALEGGFSLNAAMFVGEYAFCACSSLTEIIIPDSIKVVASRAFAGCKCVTRLTLSKNLTRIGDAAFRDCQMSSLVIPDKVTKIGKDAFLRCNKLLSAGPIGSGCDYEFSWTEEIPNNAFSGLRKLKKAILPATIKKVGENAFNDCRELVDLTMPKTAKVGKTTFKGCDKLKEVKESETEILPNSVSAELHTKFPDGKEVMSEYVTFNGKLVMYNGESKKVVIPNDVSIIGQQAFFFNSKLTSVTLPASVHTVEREAFFGCSALKRIIFQGTIKNVGAEAFGSRWSWKKALAISISSAVPIRAHTTKASQKEALLAFSQSQAELDPNSDVFRDNLRYIGARMKQYYQYLSEDEALRREMLKAEAIPIKDVDWLVSALQTDGKTEFTAELLDYKNRLLSDKKTRKSFEKAMKQLEEKALFVERSPAEWRKLLKFSYENGDIVIKEVRIQEPVIELPDHIGTRKVRVLDQRAFYYDRKWGKTNLHSPQKIILPEGLEEIRSGAFFCVKDAEIIFPSTVKALPEYCFIDVKNLVLHIPASVTKIADELETDSYPRAFKAFCAPSGSYAEQYAKEHNIPFVAE